VELFKGLSGIAFAATAASKDGTRYQKLLANLDAEICSGALRLVSQVRSAHGLSTSQFDVISGLSGVLAYLLYNGRCNRRMVSSVLEPLIWLAGDDDGIPRIYTPARLIVNPTTAASYRAGYVNCGLAHGMPGPLAALSIAVIEGFEIPGQREAVRWYADYLLSHHVGEPPDILWPSAVSFDPNGESTSPPRLAWCYGSPGVLRALYLAGIIVVPGFQTRQ
jgi:hypothetical protein